MIVLEMTVTDWLLELTHAQSPISRWYDNVQPLLPLVFATSNIVQDCLAASRSHWWRGRSSDLAEAVANFLLDDTHTSSTAQGGGRAKPLMD